jgi:23S rRNA (uracil-5-)-methyltransferase RumA
MKLLQPISGTVERLAADGSGIVPRSDGKPFLIYNTIPGETVNATVLKRTKEGHRARLDAVVSPSPDRVEPRCPYASACGGCKWQHIRYERQLAEKLERLRSVMAEEDVPCDVESVLPCPDQFYYRNRMDFVFGRNGELGLKLPDRWWATLDLEACYLLSETSAAIVNDARAWAKTTGLPFWNSRTHDGFFRYLVIREGKNTGERLVMLVTSDAFPMPDGFADAVGTRATSIVHGINARLTDLSFADTIVPLRGNPFISETVNGTTYKITPNAFFQTNTAMAAKLQNAVRGFCGDLAGKTVLDLYCGSGFFARHLAERFPSARVVGIELSEEAIADAKAVPTQTPIDFFASAAEDFDWAGYEPDVVIVDPPRGGMHPRVIETLLAAAPKAIVYVSCKYERFAKEFNGTATGAPALSSRYRLAQSAALDLFPHTPHIEYVARLERV